MSNNISDEDRAIMLSLSALQEEENYNENRPFIDVILPKVVFANGHGEFNQIT